MKVAGLLLAGGRSTRFGSEKAVASLGPGVLMDMPLAALRDTCDAVAVSVREGSGADLYAAILGLSRLVDAPDDADGPLAGIRRGLVWAAEAGFDWLAVAPCDAPTLRAGQYQALLQAVADGAPGAVGETEAGLEPLVSLWPVGLGLSALEAGMAGGGHPAIRAVLDAIGAARTPLAGYDGRNVNTPTDLNPPPSTL